ncbi:MAG: VWA domain-containing protein [Gammaproteobacteria bacterium]
MPSKSSTADINSFLAKVRVTPAAITAGKKGRLIFAMDATASREPSWDHASQLQAQMFSDTANLGGLEIQLCYYRGFAEFHASPWLSNTDQLLRQMTAVHCSAGHTQINKILKHCISEAKTSTKSNPGLSAAKINALVFIGDSVEEDIDKLGHTAGELGLLGIPAFMFHEGHDPITSKAFQQIAQLSGGAYCPFDAGSAKQLRDLLSAVAVYAAGGHKALENFHTSHGHVILRLNKQK